MQLRKRVWSLVALGAAAMMGTACGSGGLDLSCAGPADCLESELCHPADKVCVQLCTSRADCPPEAVSCDATIDTGNERICKCPTKECVGSSDP